MEGVASVRLAALVGHGDADARIQERKFAEPSCQGIIIIIDLIKDGLIGSKGDGGTVFVLAANTNDLNLGYLDALLAYLPVDLAVTPDLCPQFIAQSIYDRKTHSVQSAGNLVAASAELAACVEHGQRHFKRGFARLGMNVHGDAPAVIDNGYGVVKMNINIDVRAITCHRFINGVIHYLIDEVMQASCVGRTDIHAGAAANCLQALKHLNLRSVIIIFHSLLFLSDFQVKTD